MSASKARKPGKFKKPKRKVCFFTVQKIDFIDYKNVDLLKKFLNPHARILGKKRTGISAKHQRLIANAIKRARFLALLPYVAR